MTRDDLIQQLLVRLDIDRVLQLAGRPLTLTDREHTAELVEASGLWPQRPGWRSVAQRAAERRKRAVPTQRRSGEVQHVPA